MMWQKTSAPKVDGSLIGFKIEMLSNYSTDEEEVLVWCNGEVKAVAAGSRNVEIESDDKFVSEENQRHEKVNLTKVNGTRAVNGESVLGGST